MVTLMRRRSSREVLPFGEGTPAFKIYLAELRTSSLLSAEEEVHLAKQIEAGRMEKQKPVEQQDASIIAAGKQAYDQFVEANLRLVVRVAHLYVKHGQGVLGFDDLVQEGNLGLLHALDHFDYRLGYRFSSYATWWIRQAVGRACDEQIHLIRQPVHRVTKMKRINRAVNSLTTQTGTAPTTEQIAAEVELPPEVVADLLEHDYRMLSLDKPLLGTEEKTLGEMLDEETLVATATQSPEPVLTGWVLEAIQTTDLTSREREVVTLRYGLDGSNGRSLEEVGRLLTPRVSRERVRQLEQAALRKLQLAWRRRRWQ